MNDDRSRAQPSRDDDAPDADAGTGTSDGADADTATAPGSEGATATDVAGTAEDDGAGDGGLSRRRLVRWVAVLAFGVPVVVEGVTFGRLFVERLLGGDGDGDGTGVGAGDELLPSTAVTETVVTTTVRGDGADRTYVLRVAVENTTDDPVELRLAALRLADGTTVESVSGTGRIAPGERGEVTGAWALGADGDPESVRAVALRNGAVVHEASVPVATGRS